MAVAGRVLLLAKYHPHPDILDALLLCPHWLSLAFAHTFSRLPDRRIAFFLSANFLNQSSRESGQQAHDRSPLPGRAGLHFNFVHWFGLSQCADLCSAVHRLLYALHRTDVKAADSGTWVKGSRRPREISDRERDETDEGFLHSLFPDFGRGSHGNE